MEFKKSNDLVIAETKVGIANGREISHNEVFNLIDASTITSKQVKELADIFLTSSAEIRTHVKNFKRQRELNEGLGIAPKNEYEFVNGAFNRWNATYDNGWFYLKTNYKVDEVEYSYHEIEELDADTQTSVKLIDPKTLTATDIRAKLIKTNAELKLGFTDKQIEHALNDWIRIEENKEFSAMYSSVKFRKNNDKEWKTYISAITDVNLVETEVVMKHFIWQIKRKLMKLPVDYHMMPILYGDTKIGKSTQIKQLLKPILSYTGFTNFSDITNSKYHAIWKNFALVFDEMGKASTSDIDIIKNRITCDSFDSRILSTNTGTKVVNNSTMIGSSNKDLTRILFDDTGMRRFYQIDCRKSFNWEITNNIDYLALWRSIDENAPTPLLSDPEVFARIEDIQDSKRFVGVVESFLLDRKYKNGLDVIKASDFYNEYQLYEGDFVVRSDKSATAFGAEVIDVSKRISGLEIYKKRGNSCMNYYITKK